MRLMLCESGGRSGLGEISDRMYWFWSERGLGMMSLLGVETKPSRVVEGTGHHAELHYQDKTLMN
jgi:hypothetical protein